LFPLPIEGLAVYSIELWAARIVTHFTVRASNQQLLRAHRQAHEDEADAIAEAVSYMFENPHP
jgi:hypothetical protein